MKAAEKIIELTKRIGSAVPYWVQGAGGNVSIKTEKSGKAVLLIKPSGWRMDKITKADELAVVDLSRARDGLSNLYKSKDEKQYANLLSVCNLSADKSVRPSMESGFHAVLSKPIVIHFHSLAAILMAHEVRKAPADFLQWLNGNWKHTHEFIDVCAPGLVLTGAVHSNADRALYLLENHGVILQDENGGLLGEWEKLETAFCDRFGRKRLCSLRNVKDAREAWSKNWSDVEIPLRVYFPDMAAFLTKIKPFLIPSSSINNETAYRLKPEAWQQNPSMAEIWFATQILYTECPSLKEMPASMVDLIIGLPMEEYRRSLDVPQAQGK